MSCVVFKPLHFFATLLKDFDKKLAVIAFYKLPLSNLSQEILPSTYYSSSSSSSTKVTLAGVQRCLLSSFEQLRYYGFSLYLSTSLRVIEGRADQMGVVVSSSPTKSKFSTSHFFFFFFLVVSINEPLVSQHLMLLRKEDTRAKQPL